MTASITKTLTPRRPLVLYLQILAFTICILTIFRFAFWFFISANMETPFVNMENWNAFYIGFRFDARISAIFTFPFAVILSVPCLAKLLSRFKTAIFLIYLPAFILLVTLYFLDFGFYAYLGIRLNTTIFELIQDTAASIHMVIESYPIVPIILGGLALSLAFAFTIKQLVRHQVQPSPQMPKRIAGWVCGFIIFAIAAYGQISSNLFPLRWSNAYVFSNKYAVALALNPAQNLYDTWRFTKSAKYDLARTRAAYPLMVNYLGVDTQDKDKLNFTRKIVAEDSTNNTPNIVIIIMESLSYPKTSFAPGKGNPTPRLKELGKESIIYHRFFSNTRTTARAVFTTMTGVPDVNADGTASRNPYVVDQHLIASEFKGYNKFYMIGGSTSWANIRAVLSHNVPDLKIMEEGSWKAPNVDVWGISDYDLFQETNNFLASLAKTDDKPFLAVIQTSGFHKPYTVPKTPGFTEQTLSEEDKNNYGFIDQKEYNSMLYADFAVGEFIAKAKQEKYYKNTIFFIFGDHGLNDNSANLSKGYQLSQLAGWHIPLIIHAPGIGLSGESCIPASQVDIFPTAAKLAGIDYTNYALGRELLSEKFMGKREVYVGGNQNTDLRMISDNGLYCYFSNRAGGEHLYRLDDQEGKDFAGEMPELFSRLKALANAIDETSRYMLYHNK